MIGHFATKSLSSISVLRICPGVNFEAVANDKDGNYSLFDPEVLTNIHLQLLENGQYFQIGRISAQKHRCHTLPCVNVSKIPRKNQILLTLCVNPCRVLEPRLKCSLWLRAKVTSNQERKQHRTIEATPNSVTVTLATSSKTSQPSKHRLNTILCVWTPKSFS